MKRLGLFSFRQTVPALIALTAGILVIVSAAHTWWDEDQEWRSLMRRRAIALGHTFTPRLEQLWNANATSEITREMANLATVPSLNRALVLDDRDRIRYGTEIEWLDRPLAETVSAGARPLIAAARAGQSTQVEITPDQDVLRAAFVFPLPPLPGEIRPSRTGVLYTESDLAAQRKHSMAEVAERSLVMVIVAAVLSGGVWIYFHQRYSRRVEALVAAAGAVGRGETPDLTGVSGQDELARIGEALEQMGRTLREQYEKIRASEANYRSLARNFPNGAIFVYDRDMRYTLVEGRELAALGLTREAFERQPVGAVVPGLDELIVPRARAALAGQASSIEVPFGGRYYQLEFSPIYDAELRISGGIVVGQNILDRKRAEDQLRASEARFANLLQNIDGIVWKAAAPFSRLSFVSQQAERILGYPLGRWLGEPNFWLERVHPEDRERAQEFRLRCAREGVSGSDEYRILRADGAPLWIRDYVTVERQDGVTYRLQGIMVDISRSKAAELELIESENHYRTLFESSPDAVLLLAGDGPERGLILDVNRATSAERGWTRDELLGRRIGELVADESADAAHERVTRVLAGAVNRYEGIHQRKDGTQFPVDVFAQPFRWRDQVCVLMIARDITQQRRAAAEIREREDQLRRIADTVPGMICSIELASSGAISLPYVSAAAAQVLGIRAPALVGSVATLEALMRPAEVQRWRESLAESRRRLSQWHAILPLQHPDKGEVILEGFGTPEARPDGAVRWYAVLIDVTSRWRAEAMLAEHQRRLRSTFESMLEGVVVQGLDGRIEEANQAAEQILGLNRDQIAGRTSLDPRWRAIRADGTAFPGDEHPAMISLRTGEGQRNVVMGVHKPDGSLTWIEINSEVMRDERQRMSGVVCTFTDMTARRLAELQVRLSEARLDGIINSAIDGIITIDEDGKIVVFNGAAEKMFGYTRGEVIGTPLSALLPERFRGAHGGHIRSFGAGRNVSRAMGGAREIAGRRRNGEEFPIEASISWIEIGEQKLFTVILRDVTQRQADQRRRRELEQQLMQAQKLETLGTLTGAIAHDFNNLLTGILGHIDLASSARPGDPAVPEMLGTARRGALMARDLVKRLLLFARKRAEGPIGPVDVAALLRDTVPLLTTAAGVAINVRAKTPPAALHVMGDASQLQQVLMNLGINAVHAIGEQPGEILLALDQFEYDGTRDPDPTGPVLNGTCARIIVRDSGSGMDEETRRRLFEPFFTTKQAGHGTGLGLAIVHGVVFAHGGRIRVESAPGEGTTFTVYLPVVVPAVVEAPGAAGSRAPARPLAGLRVMVVDDELIVASLLQSALRSFGAHVQGFTSSKAALAAFRENPAAFDAAVLDLAMPALDGIQLAHAFRSLRPGLVLTLVSGDMYRHAVASFENDGRTILMHKPFEMEELQSVMERIRRLVDLARDGAAGG